MAQFTQATDLGRVPAPRSARDSIRTSQLDNLREQFRRSGKPIHVSFRELVGPVPADELTHAIHHYPARVLRQVPKFYLQCPELFAEGDLVLDPFCGSGTVLLEAALERGRACGVDSNPFARLLSAVKTTPVDRHLALKVIGAVLSAAKRFRSAPRLPITNGDFWFAPQARFAIERLARAIDEQDLAPGLRDLLRVALSATTDKCSLRDPRIPVPVRRCDADYIAEQQSSAQVWSVFRQRGDFIANRVHALPWTVGQVTLSGTDARDLSAFESSPRPSRLRPRLAITSPPYGAAQKYVRSSSFSIGVLGLAPEGGLAQLERASIGREHILKNEVDRLRNSAPPGLAGPLDALYERDAIRGAIYTEYFNSMNRSLNEIYRVLAPDGHLVLIAGSNTVAGQPFPTSQYLAALAEANGFRCTLALKDTIRGRVLLTNRATTAGEPIAEEYVYLMSKS